MNRKILIVDDELHILESVSYVVRSIGMNPLTAEDGEEAVRLAQAEKPDLIILDVMLPKLSGIQVCERIRANPETRQIPILMLSARGQESDEVQGMQAGADEYMTKPFSPRRLGSCIEEMVQKHGEPGR
jgi:two-component system alkaline phosphatase synthesis response regulator PhoP